MSPLLRYFIIIMSPTMKNTTWNYFSLFPGIYFNIDYIFILEICFLEHMLRNVNLIYRDSHKYSLCYPSVPFVTLRLCQNTPLDLRIHSSLPQYGLLNWCLLGIKDDFGLEPRWLSWWHHWGHLVEYILGRMLNLLPLKKNQPEFNSWISSVILFFLIVHLYSSFHKEQHNVNI